MWIKIGGDKGGGSFKMSLQLANVPHPNSVKNTFVFCCFEASDSVTNLHIGLDMYRDQINALSEAEWKYVYSISIIKFLSLLSTNRGRKIRVFLFGDYEFQTRSYGLSGASGEV